LVTAYTVDVVIAMEDGEQPSQDWWSSRYRWGAVRAGGMPIEVADPLLAAVTPQTDPDTGDRFARVRFPIPKGTPLGRARELAHMLTSVLAAEGYTLRSRGKKVETLPGNRRGEPNGSLGATTFSEGRVCSEGCLACVFDTDTRLGCCGQGAAFSLADIGAALVDGDDQFVVNCLALPGERDGVKWHPYLAGGRCVYHDHDKGCTLTPARMPLQCRTYLCLPDRLLPPALLADYTAYVQTLDDAEEFIEEHMRLEGGVDFGSPLAALKKAAAAAFGARSGQVG